MYYNYVGTNWRRLIHIECLLYDMPFCCIKIDPLEDLTVSRNWLCNKKNALDIEYFL